MVRDRRRPARLDTIEAMALLLLARVLIAQVPFGRWRAWLGRPVCAAGGPNGSDPKGSLAARRLAGAVERGAIRLPGEFRCLPRAMALQWMLRRRGLNGVLTVGVRGGMDQGGVNDLHAWVSFEDEILVGASEERHYPLFAAAGSPAGVHPDR